MSWEADQAKLRTSPEREQADQMKRLAEASDLMAKAVQAMGASMDRTANAMERLVNLIEKDMEPGWGDGSSLPTPNEEFDKRNTWAG